MKETQYITGSASLGPPYRGEERLARLIRSTVDQLRDAMNEGGHITPDELDQDLRRLEDPDSLILTPTLWSVWGRRPQSNRRLSNTEAFVGARI